MKLSIIVHRKLILRRAFTAFRHRYAGSGMGVLWNVVQPLLTIGIFALVFSKIMPVRFPSVNENLSYTIFLCAGYFPWLAYSECINNSCYAILNNSQYLRKLPFPDHIIFAETLAMSAISMALNYSVFLLFLMWQGQAATWYWLLMPVPLGLLLIQAYAIGLVVGTLNVFIRDTGPIVSLGLMLAMWTAPVIYPIELLPEALRPLIFLNPVTALLVITRDIVLYSQLPSFDLVAQGVGWTIGFLGLAYFVRRRLKGEVRDMI